MTNAVIQYLIEGVITGFFAVASAVLINRLNKIQHTVDGTNAALREALASSKEETLTAVKEALAFERARENKP